MGKKKTDASILSHKIKKQEGKILNPKDINDCLRQFYEGLFESKLYTQPAAISVFL